MQEKNIQNNGGYDLEGVIWHQHSNHLMKKILELWTDKKVPILDLGCGHNFYVSVLNYAGYNAIGVDSVDLGSKNFVQEDITKIIIDSLKIFKRNVICLEVGEHIPMDKSEHLLSTITALSHGGEVIMSWAVPGQAGVGHINCQSNEWVISRMFERGYKLDHEKTIQLRESVKDCHCSWFRNSLMYFSK